jgi:hypothetical protein
LKTSGRPGGWPFDAWVAQDPLHNPAAMPSPLLMPEYHLAQAAQSDSLERRGDPRFNDGRAATYHTVASC